MLQICHRYRKPHNSATNIHSISRPTFADHTSNVTIGKSNRQLHTLLGAGDKMIKCLIKPKSKWPATPRHGLVLLLCRKAWFLSLWPGRCLLQQIRKQHIAQQFYYIKVYRNRLERATKKRKRRRRRRQQQQPHHQDQASNDYNSETLAHELR